MKMFDGQNTHSLGHVTTWVMFGEYVAKDSQNETKSKNLLWIMSLFLKYTRRVSYKYCDLLLYQKRKNYRKQIMWFLTFKNDV